MSILASQVHAATTVLEGFENTGDPGGWRQVSPSSQTHNAVNQGSGTPPPAYVATHVTEGVNAGSFTHGWTIPGVAAGSNPYTGPAGTLSFWSMRNDLATPAGLASSSVPNGSDLRCDVFINTPDSVQFALVLIDSSNTQLERGPLVTIPAGVQTTYQWIVSDATATAFVTGNGNIDGTPLIKGFLIYTETQPTSATFDIDVDNIRIEGAQTDTTPPTAPVVLSAVQGAASDEIIVRWLGNTEPDLASYRVYVADDDRFGATIQNRFTWPSAPAATVLAGTNQVTLTNVTPEANLYVRVSAVDNATPTANESVTRVALGVRTGTGSVRDLVVLDNDAISFNDGNFATQGYSHNIVYNGQALTANSRYYDSCTAAAVSTDAVSLTSVDASEFVIWSAGTDGGSGFPGESIAPGNQTRIAAFLSGGGKLFISSRSLGESLDTNGSVADQTFYNTVLQADLATAFANTNEILLSGLFASAGTIYTGADIFNFGAGGGSSGESLLPQGSAFGSSSYNPAPGAGGNAIVYFGNQLVYLGVDFELLRHVNDSTGTFAQAAAKRAQFLGDVIAYLFPAPVTSVDDYQTYR